MKRIVLIVLAFLALSSVYLPTAADGPPVYRPGTPARVMSQNLYVGGNLFHVLDAQTPQEIPFAVAGVFETIQQTSFSERAARIAEEIKDRRPDLIGLQEVSRITLLAPGNPPTVEVFDYLDELQQALELLGLDYYVAAVVENADIELPIVTSTGLGLARLVDRDVILARASVATSNVTTRNYAVNLVFPIGNPPVAMVQFLRGFAAVDARIRGTDYRFVNTHLEVRGTNLDPAIAFIQAAQAQELIAELSDELLPIIVVGDFNSAPVDPILPPLFPPYAQFLAAGYVDAWTSRMGFPEAGFTCCQEETLTNPMSLLSRRIDQVWLNNHLGPVVGPVEAFMVGDEPSDRTPSGLWLSDHAGVDARLRMPVPINARNVRAGLSTGLSELRGVTTALTGTRSDSGRGKR